MPLALPAALRTNLISAAICLLTCALSAQSAQPSEVWVSDQGNGTYRNPILFADYSDPDAIRVGKDFYLVASSFDQVPGLPILHSKDLVNWELIAHALPTQPPTAMYNSTQHGNGVWAPSLRFHKGKFYIYYPDPEIGIYVTTATGITGPWTPPKLIKAAKGWIDPCPLWDDDGHAYLINGMAASRSGIKNVLILSRMSDDGDSLLDDGTLLIDGHGPDTTLEGPKLYKRNGYYYVFAPAGGVSTGYQLVFRSRSIYGPYERRVVMAQGSTTINGPHQGAWVDTPSGENWFLHFQDRGPYGRVTLLEPVRWVDGWPIIGTAPNQQGISSPVTTYRKPKTLAHTPIATPADSDEFNAPTLGLQWQWQANPQPGWAFPSASLGVLRLSSIPTQNERLWDTPNVLLTKLPGPQFTATTKLDTSALTDGDRTGLVLLGRSYAYLAVRRKGNTSTLAYGTAPDADKGKPEHETELATLSQGTLYLRVTIAPGASATFSYSTDGEHFAPVAPAFQTREGVWIGAKLGLFAQTTQPKRELGYTDFDWFRFEN